MTLGSCPSLGSNSLGSSLRQSSRRLCSSLSFFSSTALPLDRPMWLGWLKNKRRSLLISHSLESCRPAARVLDGCLADWSKPPSQKGDHSLVFLLVFLLF